jgi:hypothetical protein
VDALTAALHLRFSHAERPASATPKPRPVRITVDLTPELYRKLTRWTAEATDELGAVKLPLADVVRAFIRAADDPATRARVVEELRSAKQ